MPVSRESKDDMRRECETHAGYHFSELEWGTVRELRQAQIARISLMLRKAYTQGRKDLRDEELLKLAKDV